MNTSGGGASARRPSVGGLLSQFAQQTIGESRNSSRAGSPSVTRPSSPAPGQQRSHRGRHVPMDSLRRMSTLASFVKDTAASSVMKAARDGVNGGLMLEEPPPPSTEPPRPLSPLSPQKQPRITGAFNIAAVVAAASAQSHVIDPKSYEALILKHGKVSSILRTGEAVGEVVGDSCHLPQ